MHTTKQLDTQIVRYVTPSHAFVATGKCLYMHACQKDRLLSMSRAYTRAFKWKERVT